MIPKAAKRLRFIFLFISLVVIMAAVPIFTMPPKVSTEGAFLAGKCYVGSCGMDMPQDIPQDIPQNISILAV